MDRASRFCRLEKRFIHYSNFFVWIAFVCLSGCQSWISKDRDKENHFVKETRRIQELMVDPDRPRLIGEVASSLGMRPSHYDSFAIAANLPGTGGSVRPGTQRELILTELRTRETESPEAFLDDPSTALVKLRIVANPCNAKGDILDVQVENSSECSSTSLFDGFVLESRLCEMVMLNGRMRIGEPKGSASGEVVVQPTSFTGLPELTPLQGVIIGGARLKEDQPVALRVEAEFRHVIVTRSIEKAINSRYFYKDSNKQKLVAEGTSDWYVKINTVPKYKHDPTHFLSVIRCTGFGESVTEQEERLRGCKKLLFDRTTTRRAAAELEAMGTDAAKETLIGGLSSDDIEVRFYSAYSLAYLDCKESVPVLLELARTTPASRPLCLIGLAINEDSSARETLEQLLQEPDPDLRFGAFRAIRQRNPTDLTVQGEVIANNFQFVQIPSSIPLITVSLQKQKEVVLFGNSIDVMLSEPIAPTALLTLTPVTGGQIKLSKRHTNGETRNAIVASNIIAVLRGLGNIQANYNDVVHTLDRMALKKAITTPVAMNPLHNQDSRVAAFKNNDSTEFNDPRVVNVDHASVIPSSNAKSGWWSSIGWRKSFGNKARAGIAKGYSDSSSDKELPTHLDVSDE